MARNKIDYGIDLGTTNSAISRMEKGEPIVIKTDDIKRHYAFLHFCKQERLYKRLAIVPTIR